MISIFDSTTIIPPEHLQEERFVLSRKNGKLRLKARSPLFEEYFSAQAKGEVGEIDPLWKVPLYRVNIDSGVDQELLREGVTFNGIKGFWRDFSVLDLPAPRPPRAGQAVPPRRPPANAFIDDGRIVLNGPVGEDPFLPYPDLSVKGIKFNISFLLAKGLGNGLEFQLSQIPLSLIEGPSFIYTTTLRKGLFYVMKQFLADYEATVVIQSNVKL